jgi:hypothetical protein
MISKYKKLLKVNFKNRLIPKLNSKFIPKFIMSLKYENIMKDGKIDGKILNLTKVVVDIDDTIKSSGGGKFFNIKMGGVDTQYRRGTFYPAVFQLAYELTIGKSDVNNSIANKISVLTARAKEFKFAIGTSISIYICLIISYSLYISTYIAIKQHDELCSQFRLLGIKNGLKDWGIGDIYYGSVKEWVRQERKGKRKLDNFEIMMNRDDMIIKELIEGKQIEKIEEHNNNNINDLDKLHIQINNNEDDGNVSFVEHDDDILKNLLINDNNKDKDINSEDNINTKTMQLSYIFIGDTGEKDEEAAERIAEKHPKRIKAAFLHFVYEVKRFEL